MTPRIVLVAPRGMLGVAFVKVFESRKLPFVGLDHARCDITDAASVRAAIGAADLIVNCAAWTDVDGAEADEDGAMRVNGEGVAHLANRARELHATLVHFSTDYVFDGVATSPYEVDAPIAPINAYGRTKAEGERCLKASGARHLLVRTSWLYAPWGKNFVRTIAKACRERDRLRVVDDQRGRPTSSEHLAATSLKLYESGATGTFHVTDGGQCSWFDLATFIASIESPRCVVEPCSSAEYVRPAKRPAYSVLDLGPTEAIAGAMPHWRGHVARVLADMRAAD